MYSYGSEWKEIPSLEAKENRIFINYNCAVGHAHGLYRVCIFIIIEFRLRHGLRTLTVYKDYLFKNDYIAATPSATPKFCLEYSFM